MDKMAKARIGAKLSVQLNWERIYTEFIASGLSIRAFHHHLMETGADKYSSTELHGYVPSINTVSKHFQTMKMCHDRQVKREVRVIELTESSIAQELRMSSGGVEISFSCDDPARAAAEVLHHLKVLEGEGE